MKHHEPTWLKSAVFYEIYPSSFYDGNGDGMGDLPGIIQKLDYLVDLGINAIWMNPCFCSTFHDGGYDITDYRHVDPRFGTDKDLETLIDECHKRGLKLCLDMVPGHTSIEHPWFKASAQEKPNKYSNYYIWTDDWARSTGGMQSVSGASDRNGSYIVNYYSVQPALNYGFAKLDPECPWQLPVNHPDVLKVRQELVDNMRYYLDKGVDGFRVDMACSLVKKDPGKKETIKLWQKIRAIFDSEYPEAALISEWSYAPQALKAGFHCDFMIHCGTPAVTTLFRNEEKRDLLSKIKRELMFEPDGNDYRTPNRNSYFDEKGLGSTKMFFDIYLDHLQRTKNLGYISIPTGNHDEWRISSYRSDEELKTIFAFLLTLPGVPFIYYGDEIGMRNLPFVSGKEGGYTRTQARTPMQWDATKNLGFSKADAAKLYLPVDPASDAPTAKKQQANVDSLWHCVKKLVALRRATPTLQAKGNLELLRNDYPTVYLRTLGRERYLIAINPAKRAYSVTVKLPQVKDAVECLASNTTITLAKDKVTLASDGIGFGIWKLC